MDELRKVTVQQTAKALINAVENDMRVLRDRWEDEKEYEDWADYRVVIERIVEESGVGVRFVKATRRPFGFRVAFMGYLMDCIFGAQTWKVHFSLEN